MNFKNILKDNAMNANLKNITIPNLQDVFGMMKSFKPQRPMKYPYTLTAKIAQFPFKFYFNNNWVWKYYPFGILLSVPIFLYISRLANSATNKAVWAEKRRRELEEHH